MESVIWVKCNGEAHLPEVAGNIDHCGICMPFWDKIQEKLDLCEEIEDLQNELEERKREL